MLARVLFAPDAPLSDKLLGVAILVVFAGFFFLVGWVILKLLRFSKSVVGGVEADAVVTSIGPNHESMGQHHVVFTFTTYTGELRFTLAFDAQHHASVKNVGKTKTKVEE